MLPLSLGLLTFLVRVALAAESTTAHVVAFRKNWRNFWR
jgi:hypothetical protein